MFRPVCTLLISSLLLTVPLWSQAKRPADFPHPRLLFPKNQEKQVAQKIASDPLAAALQKVLLQRADEALKSRTCRFEKYDGKRLLPESRLALGNVLHLAWAWRTTAEPKYRDRAFREMEAICAMDSWNPDHFLDTAEMSTALAIGYDWLYAELTPEKRRFYEQQLLKKGMLAVDRYAKANWWVGPSNNWAQVCGTGMAFAAMALDEVEPKRCQQIMEHSERLIDQCESFYLPDGAYPEGPDYWHYGSNYHVLHLAATRIWQQAPVNKVWRSSGEFMIHNSGGSGFGFNFADGGMRKIVPTAAQTWIAAQFPDSILPQQVREQLAQTIVKSGRANLGSDNRFDPLHLLWLPAAPTKQSAAPPRFARFRGEQALAFFRSGWGPDDAWLAIKGGTGAASHGHMDVGSFVYDARGVRWFIDMGKENYNLPGYFGKQRWDYFRLNNRSHNTLVIGDQLQATPEIGCEVSEIGGSTEIPSCKINLSSAYAKQAASVLRESRFTLSTGKVDLLDTIVKPVGPVRWAVVTDSAVTIKGNQVVLKKNGKTLTLTREDRSGGGWQEYSLKPPTDKENPNKGLRMIGFTAPKQEQLQLHVSWTP